jgi:hypothetical protein
LFADDIDLGLFLLGEEEMFSALVDFLMTLGDWFGIVDYVTLNTSFAHVFFNFMLRTIFHWICSFFAD